MTPGRYGSLSFAEAIAFFRQKQALPSQRWADVWRDAHNRSFMVAGAMETDLLADLRQLVDSAIASGRSLTAFKKEFTELAGRHGWDFTGSPGWRSRVIYETNIRQSYSAGRERQIEQVKHLRPYALYQHGDSLHPRLWHLKWHNLVLRVDDPWWNTHTPTNGWGCKCKKFTLSERQLKARGLTLGSAPPLAPREWLDKATGELHQVPAGIDPGFDYRPQSLSQDNQRLHTQLKQQPPLAERLPKRHIVDSVLSTIKGVDARGLDALLTQLPEQSQQHLRHYLQAAGTRSLFLKQGEISPRSQASRKIAAEVAEYLDKPADGIGWYYASRKPSRTNGFTATSFNHVVVKSKAANRLAKVDMQAVMAAAAKVIDDGIHNTGPSRYRSLNNSGDRLLHWSVSTEVRKQAGDAGALVATWLHELGHQVHFAMGTEPLPPGTRFSTRYGWSNTMEAFAEAFAVYMLAPKQLRRQDPVLATWLENAIASAIHLKRH